MNILVQLFWICIAILESDYEHEFILGLRLLDKVSFSIKITVNLSFYLQVQVSLKYFKTFFFSKPFLMRRVDYPQEIVYVQHEFILGFNRFVLYQSLNLLSFIRWLFCSRNRLNRQKRSKRLIYTSPTLPYTKDSPPQRT